MIELNKNILNDIEEYAKVKRELMDFEKELKDHQAEAKKLSDLQEESFNFERAKELNLLNTTIQQAVEALNKRKRDTQKVTEGDLNLQYKIKRAIEAELKHDSDLVAIEKAIFNSIDSILNNIEEYRLQLRFKRDKHIEDVATLSEENISRLLQSARQITDHTPFSNNHLESVLKSYKASLTEKE